MQYKIYIEYKFKFGAWGGANQYLGFLKEALQKDDLFTNDPINCDAILVNLNPSRFIIMHLLRAIFFRLFFGKKIICRLDGPVYYIRHKDKHYDELFYRFCSTFADHTIFQSDWSKKNFESITKRIENSTIIWNGSRRTDPNCKKFLGKERNELGEKKHVFISSWSSNTSKGFDLYQQLDEVLDHEESIVVYFAGNSPVKFKNIINIGACPASDVRSYLLDTDIYLTCSRNDPCSNSLIEALVNGIQCVALDDGGHTELVKSHGILIPIDISGLEILTLLKGLPSRRSAPDSRVVFSFEYSYKKYNTAMLKTLKAEKKDILPAELVSFLFSFIRFSFISLFLFLKKSCFSLLKKVAAQ